MKGLLELITILSMLVVLGASFWMGLSLLSTSKEVGDGSLLTFGKLRGPMTVAGIALVINLSAGFAKRRM